MNRTIEVIKNVTRILEPRRLARGLTILGVAVFALSGCTSNPDDTLAPTAAATTPAAVSTNTPGPSVATSSAKPAPPAKTTASGPTVGKALAAAIDDLSYRKRNLLRLDEARKQLQVGNDALKQARTSITAIRGAVYGSSRNCTAARTQNNVVRTKAGVAASEANAVIATVISRRGELVGLSQVTTAVERQVTAQGSTLTSMPNVKAAVSSARTTIITETSATNKVNEAAASLRSNAFQVGANGSQILAKTC